MKNVFTAQQEEEVEEEEEVKVEVEEEEEAAKISFIEEGREEETKAAAAAGVWQSLLLLNKRQIKSCKSTMTICSLSGIWITPTCAALLARPGASALGKVPPFSEFRRHLAIGFMADEISQAKAREGFPLAFPPSRRLSHLWQAAILILSTECLVSNIGTA